jgi:hypothetical protein
MVEPYLRSYSRHFPQFMKLEGSLQHSKQAATCPYIQPDESNPLPPIIFIKTISIFSSTYVQIVHVICFLLVTSSEHSMYVFP